MSALLRSNENVDMYYHNKIFENNNHVICRSDRRDSLNSLIISSFKNSRLEKGSYSMKVVVENLRNEKHFEMAFFS